MTADHRDLALECLADDLDRCEHSRRELIALLVDVLEELEMWKRFADQQFRKRVAAAASAFCFPSARCRYWQPDRTTSTALQGQVIVYAGPHVGLFTEQFSPLGLVLVRPSEGKP